MSDDRWEGIRELALELIDRRVDKKVGWELFRRMPPSYCLCHGGSTCTPACDTSHHVGCGYA